MANIKVDFSHVEESSPSVITPGRYSAVVESTSVEEGKQAPYIQWNLRITSNPCAGLHIRHMTSLAPKALFSLRNTLVAFGVNVPKSAVHIDPDKFIGKSLGIEVAMTTKDGNEYPNVKSVFALGTAVPSQSAQAPAAMPAQKAMPVQATAADDEVTITLD